jgi:ABC-type multidrug transport system fused ATPase/permease subunit
MEDPTATRNAAVTYAVITLLSALIQSFEQVLSVWFGRRIYERSRGEMILMVYEKALSRKNFSSRPKKNEENSDATENGDSNGHSNGQLNGANNQKSKPGFFERWMPWSQKKSEPAQKDKSGDPASAGKVLNIIRTDVYEVAQRFWEAGDLISLPIGAVVSGYLVWDFLGPSSLLAIFSILAAQCLVAYLTRYQIYWTTRRKAMRDERLQVSSQYIEVIRHLRWYGWQDEWLVNVLAVRIKELWVRVHLHCWFLVVTMVNSLAYDAFPVIAFATYTLLDKHELRVDLIFPALQIFDMLSQRLREIPQQIQTLANAYVAAGRIESFMAEPEKEHQSSTVLDSSNISLNKCSFAWPETEAPILKEISLSVHAGLTVIIGKVGAGKTALLQAILGEMDLKSGTCELPNSFVGYCAQTPWLQSMNIRENILFFTPYDATRYREVIDACELLPDFALFKDGDLSNIGENGIGLSGGQKARVALARAIYSHSTTLLLDDPLSALDHHTSELIVKKLFSGRLLKDRTIILVTHRIDLVNDHASQILEIDDGKLQKLDVTMAPEVVQKDQEEAANQDVDDQPQTDGKDVTKFIEDEMRADWGVQFKVYWLWIKSGKFKWWITLACGLALGRIANLFNTWFLKAWGEAYGPSAFMAWFHSAYIDVSAQAPAVFIKTIDFKAPFKNLPDPSDNVRPWILVYLYITLFRNLCYFFFRSSEIPLMFACSEYLYEKVMRRVSSASFRYYDVTPIGRLLNRLTSDISMVDGQILWQFERILFDCLLWVASAVVIASITPTFLIFCIFLAILFALIFLRYLPLSQSLRRLETVSLSPLFANFGELLQGLTTVRAFGTQSKFQDRVIATVDTFQGMDHFYWSLQAWLSYRYNTLASLAKFVLTMIALYSDLTPGLTAFTLLSASGFVSATKDLCKRYGELQMNFISVERIEELLHIDQEEPGTLQPPAHWPSFDSEIEFDNVTLRYAPQLDPAVQKASIIIPAGSTTAVMGRTGSGKSTLVASILGIIRASEGKITIGGIDVNEVDINTLRRRVTFVAQEPVLFAGSLRHNLDPLKEYSDEECASVLDRVCGPQGWTLETDIESGGKNISQGQRQLVGITRAVLRHSPIIVMDEATASIDLETSMDIQRILREEMKQSTVITIAHRLEAVRDADFAIFMDHGNVAYCGPADSMPKLGTLESGENSGAVSGAE